MQRHTRHITLGNQDPVEQWPATRRKQWRRAEREGLTVSRSTDLNLLVALHQAAPPQKKASFSDKNQLRRLLEELMKEPTTHAWVVHNAGGDAICGGVFPCCSCRAMRLRVLAVNSEASTLERAAERPYS